MSQALKMAIAANKFQLEINRNSHIIGQLAMEGRYHGVDRDINDNNYPTERQGIKEVITFCIISGELFKRA